MEYAWTNLVISLMAAALPLIGSAGVAIGRMQVTDEIDRDEHRKYRRRTPAETPTEVTL